MSTKIKGAEYPLAKHSHSGKCTYEEQNRFICMTADMFRWA